MKIVMTAFLVVSSVTAFSQSVTLTLAQAIDLALKNNGDVQSAQFSVEASREMKKTSFDIGKTTILGTFGQYNSYARDNNFTLSQAVPFSAFGSQASLNSSLVESSELKKRITENEVAYKIKQVYYHLNYAMARMALLQQQDSLFEGFLKSASLRYESGEGKLLEKTTAETQLNEVRNQQHINESNLIILRTQLKTLTNARLLPEISVTLPEEIRFDGSLDTAEAALNPTLAWMRQHVEVAQKQKKLEVAKLGPDLLVGYFNQTLIRTPNPETNVFSTSKNRFTGFQLGISIPLWFVPQRGRINSADFNQKAAQINYAYYQKTLTGEKEQAIQRFLQDRNSLAYYKTSALPNADLILTQAQVAFRNGEIGYAEYLLGVRNANSIKESYLQTLNDYNQSIIYIEFLSGIK